MVIRKRKLKKALEFDNAFENFQEFLKINKEENFTYDPVDDIAYQFTDTEQNKRFFKKFHDPETNTNRVWLIGTTNNTARSLDASGVRILESGYNLQLNKGRHPFFGGFKDKRTGKQFLDISYPASTSKSEALRRASLQAQDVIVGISENGGREFEPLPDTQLPEQGSEPVI